MMQRLRVISGLVALVVGTAVSTAASAGAQQIGSNSQGQSQTMTLTTSSQLVVETVVVKDKKGNFIPGLTAKDFTVTEDGVAQTVKFASTKTCR